MRKIQDLTPARIEVIDAVRGVALLGVLMANIVALSGFAFVSTASRAGVAYAQWDPSVLFLILFLVEAKFYSLFSFLFGVGFAVFVERAAARGRDAVRLFKRRLVGLLVIGLVHTFLIWMGDILVTYALLGFALLPFRRRDDRALLRWAAALLLLPIALYAIALLVVTLIGIAPGSAGPDTGLPPFLQRAVDGFARGSYVDIVQGNAAFTFAQLFRRLLLMFFPRVLAMFLLGFYAGRRQMFANLEQHRPLLRQLLLVGIVIGLPCSYFGAVMEGNGVALPNPTGLLEMTVKSIGIPLLALGYAGGLCLLFMRARALMHAFAPVGRMALTNYLTHSVAGIVVFYGIGFGLLGRVSLALSIAGALAFFVLQMIGSALWLRVAHFGPAEWVWRMFTYKRRFALFARQP